MAVRLVEGGLQSYDPGQLGKTTIKKGTTTPTRKTSSGSSSRTQPTPTPAQTTTVTQVQTAEQAQAAAELAAIERQRDIIVRSGGAVGQTIRGYDYKTNQPLQIDTVRKGSKSVTQVRNIETGEVTLKEYGVGRVGGTPDIRRGVGFKVERKPTQEVTITTQEEIEQPITPFVARPPFTLKGSIAQSGYIGGTLDFFSGKIGNLYKGTTSQALQFYSKETPTALKVGTPEFVKQIPKAVVQNIDLGTATRTVPYFIPGVGSVLLAGEGIETVKMSPTLGGKALGVVQIGLGSISGAQAFKKVKAIRQTQLIKDIKLQQVLGGRVKGDKAGVDVLVGYSRTQPTRLDRTIFNIKPVESISIIKQPYIVDSKGVLLIDGRGTSITQINNKIYAKSVRTTGYANQLEATSRIGRGRVVKEVQAQAGIGRINVQELAQLEATIKGGRITGFTIPSTGKISTPFIGISKEQGNIIGVLSGTPTKARIGNGVTRITGDVRNVGAIKVFDMSSLSESLRGGVTTVVKTGGKPSTPFQEALVKQVTQTTLPKVTTPATSLTQTLSPAPAAVTQSFKQQQSTYYGTGQYERTQGSGTLTVQKTKQETSLLPSTSFNIKNLQVQSFQPALDTRSRNITRQTTSTDLISETRLRQSPAISQTPTQSSALKTPQLLKTFFPSTAFVPSTRPSIQVAPKPVGGFAFKFPKSKQPKAPRVGRFGVQVRRFGKFKTIGYAPTLKEAFSIGKQRVTQTLGATFRIPGASAREIKGFRTKKEKGQVLYIEPRGRRLKRGTKEIPEINFYRGIKR